MIYNIFYDSNKEIAWSCTAPVTDEIKTEQNVKKFLTRFQKVSIIDL